MSQPVEQPNQTVNDDEAEFEPLKGFEQDYEIQTTFPYIIKNKKTGRILKDTIDKVNGYVVVSLNRKTYRKHVLVAKQFLDNPENFPQVDHISRDRTDYHLSNLRFVSPSTNSYNKSSNKSVEYQFIDDLPNNSMIIDYYETKKERREFEANKYYYYFDESNNEDVFYGKITDNLYKILHHNSNKSGNEFVALRDINNHQVCVYINRFKYQHDLL